jgi:hypothetical protein
MGFQVVVMFIDIFIDDFTYVRDVEVCMHNMICYIPGCIAMALKILGLDLYMMTRLAEPHSSIS